MRPRKSKTFGKGMQEPHQKLLGKGSHLHHKTFGKGFTVSPETKKNLWTRPLGKGPKTKPLEKGSKLLEKSFDSTSEPLQKASQAKCTESSRHINGLLGKTNN